MHCLVIYDIPNDRARVKVADACLDYGLDRLQWSAFAGELTTGLQRELMRKIRDILGERPAKVRMITIPSTLWVGQRILEQGDPDAERVNT